MSEKYIRIVLTPLAPYFLGGERGLKYDDNDTQMSKGEKYYIKSNLMPNQSSLFGVLRFLGIENPDSSFARDPNRIGTDSYRLDNASNQDFGMIKKISPLYLMRKEDENEPPAENDKENKKNKNEGDNLYFPAPMLIAAMDSGNSKKNNQYECLETDCGSRWLPLFYSEKDAELFRFIHLSDGKLLDKEINPFRYQTRVVINRKRDYNNGISTYPEKDKDFLKKDYVILDGFRFVFYAKVGEGLFDFSQEKIINKSVFIGQGKCPFAAEISDAEDFGEKMISLDAPAFSQKVGKQLGKPVTVSRQKKDCCYAFLVSDMFYEGSMDELKKHCVYAMTAQKQYRVFTTNYKAREAVSGNKGNGRFVKQNEVLHLLQAGSTFVFESREQMKNFKAYIETMPFFAHGQIAGFNGIFYYDPNEKTHSETEDSK